MKRIYVGIIIMKETQDTVRIIHSLPFPAARLFGFQALQPSILSTVLLHPDANAAEIITRHAGPFCFP